jgi:hypothetical protein
VGFVGEAPPIFAQAAGAQFVYIGYEPAAPEAEGLVVPKASPLKTVADLKGRKVALNRGSNVHYLLLKLLEKAGLAYSDIQPVFLPPADARAAFERGAVDAWLVWDPSWRRPSSRSARASWPMAGAWCPTTSSTWPSAASRSSTRRSSRPCSRTRCSRAAGSRPIWTKPPS